MGGSIVEANCKMQIKTVSNDNNHLCQLAGDLFTLAYQRPSDSDGLDKPSLAVNSRFYAKNKAIYKQPHS